MSYAYSCLLLQYRFIGDLLGIILVHLEVSLAILIHIYHEPILKIELAYWLFEPMLFHTSPSQDYPRQLQ